MTSTKAKLEPKIDQTLDEFGESLTGFEEIAIKTHFGGTLSSLLDAEPTMGVRALIFTHVHRANETNVQQSKTAAMELPLREVMAYFAESEGDLDDEGDEDTASGKDGSPDA